MKRDGAFLFGAGDSAARFPFHTILLCVESEEFNAMFSSESKVGDVRLEGYNYATVVSLFR